MGVERFEIGDLVACLAAGFTTVGRVVGFAADRDGEYVKIEHFRNDEPSVGSWSPLWLVNGTNPKHRIELGCYSQRTVDRVHGLTGSHSLDEPELWALIEKVRG